MFIASRQLILVTDESPCYIDLIARQVEPFISSYLFSSASENLAASASVTEPKFLGPNPHDLQYQPFLLKLAVPGTVETHK
jgi:hypothetical protein